MRTDTDQPRKKSIRDDLYFIRSWLIKAAGIVCFSAAILGLAAERADAQNSTDVPPADACLAANSDLTLGARLPRTEARLKSGDTLKIVAIGSSSTVGLWELRPSATYPEVMRQEILRLQPNARMHITNSGRVGDTIPGNLSRFERDVFSFKPDLVVWQLGTNDIAWGGNANDELRNQIIQGVRSLKAQGTDVILMDLQYAPMILASPAHSKVQTMISDAARQERVGLFSRFALMHRSIEAGVSPGALVSWDRLHNSKEGYDCVGRALARAILASAH